jgi:hypothetical protein
MQTTNHVSSTVGSESRCALSQRYVDLVASIDIRGYHFQKLL